MKITSWLILFVLMGCKNQSGFTVEPGQLTGTWKARTAGAQLPTRWTFDASNLYLTTDTLSSCQPAQSWPWEYRLEKNILITRYMGPGTGLTPIPEVRFVIVSLDRVHMTVQAANNQRQDFEACQ